VSFPSVVAAPDGTPCLVSENLTYPAPAPASAKATAQDEWRAYSARYPACPGAAVASRSPTLLALDAWRRVKLPYPKPWIAPGWGLTGKLAYLETNGQRALVHREDTIAGPLEIVASGRYSVDWGDDTGTTGPYDVEGGPWPDGTINHHYKDVGLYDVVVTERWTATWRLGDESGVLTGLFTQARIDDFRVEQIQVVVVPG